MNGLTWIHDIAKAAGTLVEHLVHADRASGGT
jgi:hypothetical protein